MDTTGILLIDDEPSIIEILSDVLEADYRIFSTPDVEQALVLLDKETINLIILDVVLPGMDGLQFCATLKKTTKLSHIPVIMLTAKADLDDKISGLQYGADAYIEKPFSPAHVKAQVQSLLQNRSRIQQLYAHYPVALIQKNFATDTDTAFLATLDALIEKHISNPLLDITYLATQLNMSRSSLYRKIKAASKLNPYEIIDTARLKKAMSLMQEGQYKVNEIADMTGFSSPSQFTKNFKRKYGKSPMQYLQEKK